MTRFPEIKDIKFSADDIRFLDVQAEKNSALAAFVVILALENLLELSTRVTKVTRIAELMEPMLKTTFSVLTPNWGDAAEGLAKIKARMALTDTQMHLQGKFLHYKAKFKAPQGKARDFFKALVVYYSDRGNAKG